MGRHSTEYGNTLYSDMRTHPQSLSGWASGGVFSAKPKQAHTGQPTEEHSFKMAASIAEVA